MANSYDITICCLTALYLFLFAALLILLIMSVKRIGRADSWIITELFLLVRADLSLSIRGIQIILERATNSAFDSHCLSVSMKVDLYYLMAPAYILNFAIWANFVGGAHYAAVGNFTIYKRFRRSLGCFVLLLVAAMEIPLFISHVQVCRNP